MSGVLMRPLIRRLQMLRAPQKLPSAEAAAWRSMPEAHMVGRRYALAEKLLRQHAPSRALPFMFEHGQGAAACALLFPPAVAAERDGEHKPEGADGAPVTTRHAPCSPGSPGSPGNTTSIGICHVVCSSPRMLLFVS